MTRAPSSASAAPSRGEFDETFPLAAVLSLLKKAAGDWPPPGMEAVAGQGEPPSPS